jgi:hypothetical protein
MNLQEPFRIHQIDYNNIVYTKIKTNETKKIIFIKYNEDKNNHKPFVIQIPTLLNLNDPVKITEDYYELEIPLITQEKDKSTGLINFFEELDKKIVQDAKTNSKTWFEGISGTSSIKYKKIIKESDLYKDGLVKIKIINNNEFKTLLQIENKKRINIKELPVNSWCKMLVEVYAVVINIQNNTFSLFLRPIILSFKEKEVSNYNYKFLEDSDSEKEDVDIPDSEINGIFIKNIVNFNNEKVDNATSSQVNIISSKEDIVNEKMTSILSSSSGSESSLESSTSSNECDNHIYQKSVSSDKIKLSDSSDSSEKTEDLLNKLLIKTQIDNKN